MRGGICPCNVGEFYTLGNFGNFLHISCNIYPTAVTTFERHLKLKLWLFQSDFRTENIINQVKKCPLKCKDEDSKIIHFLIILLVQTLSVGEK